MAGSSFGVQFRVTTWGESHGPAVGVVVDGCPAGVPLEAAAIQRMLDRRRPGAGPASTTRRETDRATVLSGMFEGLTTGTPIAIHIANRDARPGAYRDLAEVFRPGHGDITYQAKYGRRDWRGGGRASARETVGRVAAGAVAAQVLAGAGIRVQAYTLELGGVRARVRRLETCDHNPFGCPDPQAVAAMRRRVATVRRQGDSVGGIVEITATGVPAGLGEPVFDKLDADLAKALMSIGAVKGVEIGDGFAAAGQLGSLHNDPITPQGFSTNRAGGVLAGISSGAPLVARAAVKPIPSIAREQHTVDRQGHPRTVSVRGRHDICAIPRINVVCEAMTALVLADHLLRQCAATGFSGWPEAIQAGGAGSG